MSQPSSADATVEAIRFDNNTLQLLDQRILPHDVSYIEYCDGFKVADAIQTMVVRGAPAIGIAAAYGIALESLKQRDQNQLTLEPVMEALAQSRPTAVNLFWAIDQMQLEWQRVQHLPVDEQSSSLINKAITIHQEDIAANQTMGQLGASLIEGPAHVYTHCNAGALATGGHGTALGVIRSAHALNKIQHVYAGETRPWLQGARLTAWELMEENIPVSLCSEGAAGQLLRQGHIQWIIVGADRIAANGDVANKVGTYNLAVLAKHHGVKVMVVAPTSTFDLQTAQGIDIPIEDRAIEEVTSIQGRPIAPKGCHAINPSFDMTPHDLIDAIVCEKGILTAPFKHNIKTLLA